MRYGTHMLFGVAASATLCYAGTFGTSDIVEQGLIVLGTALGSMLPDIDHVGSKLSLRFPRTTSLIHRYFRSLGYYFGDSDYCCALSQHRGICHSFTFLIPFSIIFIFPSLFYVGIGLFLGILSHFFLDAFTPMGVMLLAPFSQKFFTFNRSHQRKPLYTLFKDDQSPFPNILLYILIYLMNILISSAKVLCIIFAVMSIIGLIELMIYYTRTNTFLYYEDTVTISIALAVLLMFWFLLKCIRKKVAEYIMLKQH